jgi:serine/threonine protein kinase/formylglycine-generating enzyme required for sulfatase activity
MHTRLELGGSRGQNSLDTSMNLGRSRGPERPRHALGLLIKEDGVPELIPGLIIDRLCDAFEKELRAARSPRLDDYLKDAPDGCAAELLAELLHIEIAVLRENQATGPEALNERYPAHAALIGMLWDEAEKCDGTVRETQHRFRVIEQIGQGGEGIVLRAYDEELGRTVVIKEPRPVRRGARRPIERFRNEARVTSLLEHPGVLPIYAVGWRDGAGPYFVTRHVPGPTFEGVVAEFHKRHAGRRRVAWTIELRALLRRYLEVCEVIRYAHERGVAHRDLKPSNLLIGTHGETVVIDWGNARVFRDDAAGDPSGPPAKTTPTPTPMSERALTTDGYVFGTLGYASPEQFGPVAHRTGTKSDVYGLGATLYHLLTGRRPFRDLIRDHGAITPSSLPLLVESIRAFGPPSPRAIEPRVPRPLDAICRRAMRPDAEDRYASVEDLERDVAAWLDGAPVSVSRDPAWRKAWRWARDHRVTAGALAATGVIAVAAGLWWASERALAATRVTSWAQDLRLANLGDVPRITNLLASEPALARETLAREMDRAPTSTLAYWTAAVAASSLDADLARRVVVQLREEPSRARELAQRLIQLGDSDAAQFSALRDQLMPLRAPLIEPLLDGLRFADKYRDVPESPERDLIAETLLLYAFDAPEVLAEAALHAPVAVYPRYVSRLLEASPDAVAAALVHLGSVVEPSWPPRPEIAALPRVASSVVAELNAFGGHLGEDFALAASVPAGRLVGLAESLRPSGYRPIRARPVVDAPAPTLSVVWTRDGLPWELAVDRRAEAIRERDEAMRGRRWVVVDVSCYVEIESGPPTFIGLWAARPDHAALRAQGVERTDANRYWASWPIVHDDTPETRALVGVSPVESAAFAAPLDPIFWKVRTRHVLPTPAGPLLCETWDNTDQWGPVVTLDDGDERALLDHLTHHETTGTITTDLSLWRAPDGAPGDSIRLGTTSLSPHGFVQPLVLPSLASAELTARAEGMRKSGHRPLALVSHVVDGEVLTTSLWHRPSYRAASGSPWELRPRARRAVLLARLGDLGPLTEHLRSREDQTVPTYLIDHAADLGLSAEQLVWLTGEKGPPAVRRAALLALGALPNLYPADPLVTSLAPRLRQLAADAPDAGLRAAASWLMRRWLLDRDQPPSSVGARPPSPDRNWFTTAEGETFVVVPGPVGSRMGLVHGLDVDPPRDAQHQRRIERSFAIAATEVTDGQFRAFLEATDPGSPLLTQAHPHGEPRIGPAIGVSWFDAARYCNWRSRREGLRPCFDEGPDGVLSLPADVLERDGYRLATEAEWEFACRAGSRATYFFGRTFEPGMPDAITSWAWWQGDAGNRVHAVALKRPNGLGLFDMLGNAHEWCLDEKNNYCMGTCHLTRPDLITAGPVAPKSNRILRGSWFDQNYPGCASGHRSWDHAEAQSFEIGFRLARTMPPDVP